MGEERIIIIIGRQIGSGGRVIAKKLAEKFDCMFYDRELLNLAAKERGFREDLFEKNGEHRGFFRTLFHLHAPHVSDNSFYNDTMSQESLFKFQSDAIRKAASEHSCVFVGRCADYVLRDMKNVVNVFVTADIDQRLQRVCQRNGCDRATARKLIANSEAERAAYYNYYTGKKWGHSESYDICVNSSKLGIDETVEFLFHYIAKRLSERKL